MAFELNKRIAIKDGFSGVIRYMGQVEGKAGEWVGIELDSPLGANDGSYMGRRYFSCAPRCGVFIRTNRLAAEGAKDGTESYVIKERQSSAFAETTYHPGYPGGLSTSRTSRDEQSPLSHHAESARHSFNLHSPCKPTSYMLDPDQSLFTEEPVPGSYGAFHAVKRGDDAAPTQVPASSPDAAALEAENKYLREQLSRCKELFYTVLSTYKAGMEKVRSELQAIQARLSRIKRPMVRPGEKELVAAIVSELCTEYKKGNKQRVGMLYGRFKDIVGKYNIHVD